MRLSRRFRANARFSLFLDVAEWVEVWYNNYSNVKIIAV